RDFKMDTKNNVWRFSNDWHYYFTAEDLNIHDYNSYRINNKRFNSTFVELEIELAKDEVTTMTGVLATYKIDREGNLDYIFLKGSKKKYKNDRGFKEVVPIIGDCFVVPFKHVRSMN